MSVIICLVVAGILVKASENIASDIEGWNDRSIGLLLMPEGPFQAILFLPCLLYTSDAADE